MQCLNPIIAMVGFDRVTGKNKLHSFMNFKKACEMYGDGKMLNLLKEDGNLIFLPCRKCVNCNLNRSREWAIRNTLEANEYDEDERLFITLTYNDECFKNNVSRLMSFINKKGKLVELPRLNYVDVQKFLKRLRKEYSQYKIRFYLCGEYGGQTFRPHYHILLYGLSLSAIDDLDLLYETKNGKFWKSEKIEKIWSLGFVNISSFSEYTAMYTARYCTKKQAHNNSLNYCFKQSYTKEFNHMSLGIGRDYIIKHNDDVYKYDEFLFHIDNKTFRLKPLKYFDRRYDIENPTHFAFIKENRKRFAQEHNYFEQLENNYGIVEYLNNIEHTTIKKLNNRKEV